MANGYLPTGISTQPIDIVGAGQRLMQTAVEQKLADIEQGRAMADESQQAALEAMSMKTIQGLDRKLQDRYSEQFDQHRQKIVDMLSKSGGVLNRQQQMQIRNEQEDIINQTMADNEAMQARNAVREFLLDPNTQYGYNMDAIAQELSNWDKKFEKGEYLGDPRTILAKHQLEAPVIGYIAQRYQPDIESLGKEEWGDFQGNVFSTTEVSGLYARNPQAVDKAMRVRNDIMRDPNVVNRYTNPDGTINEERRAEVQQRVEDAISKKISESKPYRQTTGGNGSGSRSNIIAEMKDMKFGDKNYRGVSIQGTSKAYPIQKVFNTSTGEWENKENGLVGRMVFIDPEKEVGFIRSSGEARVTDEKDNPYYVDSALNNISNKSISIENKKGSAITENSAASEIESRLKPTGFKYDEFIPNEIEKMEDGSIKISGTFKKKEEVEKRKILPDKVISKADEKYVEQILVPLVDKDQDVVYSFNMSDRPEEFEPYLDKMIIRDTGKPLRSYLGAQSARKTTTFDPTNWKK